MPRGEEWPEIYRDIVGRDARVTFPVSRLTHSGGTLVLRMWEEELRALANKLDALSMSPDKKRSALFYASCAIRAMGQKILRKGRIRDVVR